jgi:Tfp pilus assembly protein PilX
LVVGWWLEVGGARMGGEWPSVARLDSARPKFQIEKQDARTNGLRLLIVFRFAATSYNSSTTRQ